MNLSIGHLLNFGPRGDLRFWFQNFSIGSDISYDGNNYGFLPFGFSGSVVSLKGDNIDAGLAFPVTALSQGWAEEALENQWVASVDVVLFSSGSTTVSKVLYSYVGVFSTGGWDSTTLQVSLNTVLDAVGAEIPGRRLHRALVGKIPFTAQVNV